MKFRLLFLGFLSLITLQEIKAEPSPQSLVVLAQREDFLTSLLMLQKQAQEDEGFLLSARHEEGLKNLEEKIHKLAYLALSPEDRLFWMTLRQQVYSAIRWIQLTRLYQDIQTRGLENKLNQKFLLPSMEFSKSRQWQIIFEISEISKMLEAGEKPDMFLSPENIDPKKAFAETRLIRHMEEVLQQSKELVIPEERSEIRDPEKADWIPHQVRDDKVEVREDKVEVRDDAVVEKAGGEDKYLPELQREMIEQMVRMKYAGKNISEGEILFETCLQYGQLYGKEGVEKLRTVFITLMQEGIIKNSLEMEMDVSARLEDLEVSEMSGEFEDVYNVWIRMTDVMLLILEGNQDKARKLADIVAFIIK